MRQTRQPFQTPPSSACGRSSTTEAAVRVSNGYHQRLAARKARDHGGIHVQVLSDQGRRRVGQPVREGNVGEIGASEYFEINEIDVSRISNIMSKVLLNVPDITGVEILGHGVWAGIEN